jgi:hypothetical protein
MRRAVSFILYQAAWWACVLGAGTTWALAGIAGTAAYAAWHIATSEKRAREARVVLVATLLGAAGDSALVLLEQLTFGEAVQLGPLPCPLWLVALWVGFGATLTSSFSWAISSPIRAAAFGAVAGPLAYFGGTRLVDMQLGEPQWTSLIAVGVEWALAMLVLWAVAREVNE